MGGGEEEREGDQREREGIDDRTRWREGRETLKKTREGVAVVIQRCKRCMKSAGREREERRERTEEKKGQ